MDGFLASIGGHRWRHFLVFLFFLFFLLLTYSCNYNLSMIFNNWKALISSSSLGGPSRPLSLDYSFFLFSWIYMFFIKIKKLTCYMYVVKLRVTCLLIKIFILFTHCLLLSSILLLVWECWGELEKLASLSVFLWMRNRWVSFLPVFPYAQCASYTRFVLMLQCLRIG